MNRILAICHSLSPEGLNGVNVFLRSLAQTFTMERFASIHILHGPAISRKDFPAEIPIHLHPMPETQVGPAVYFHLSDLPLYPDDFVMHVDIRDAYFQSYPFAALEYSQTKLHVFAENSAKPVDQEPINLGWQNKLHANAIPDFLKGKPVVCFGVIGAGRWEVFQKHLKSVLRRMLMNQRFYGMDQTIHTTMVHENPENYILHTNEDGPVMHLHTQQPVAEIRDRRLVIKTIKGSIPAVVHQYDRYPNLQKAVYTMYGVGA